MHPDSIAYNQSLTPVDQEICDQLSNLIEQALPDAVNKVWHRHPVWFLDGNPIVGYSRLKAGVRLLFWSGRSFQTPGLKPEGTFMAADALFTSPDDIDDALILSWLQESRHTQWDYKNIVKRKGRLERLC